MGSGISEKYQNTYGNRLYGNSSERYENAVREETKYNVKLPKTHSSVESNAELVKKKYGLTEDGFFGKKTKTRARIFESPNPIEDSIEFYDKLGTGGVKEPLPNGRGTKTTLGDGTVITHRVITSTKDSPAVDIKIVPPSKIKKQKLHFVLGRR